MTEPSQSSQPQGVQLISLPIFWQVLGLSLLVLILALGINTYLVLEAPDPPPSGYRMEEAVQALKTGQAKLQNGHVLKAVSSPAPPAYVTSNPIHQQYLHQIETIIATRLARDLGVPSDTVWVNVAPRHHMSGFYRSLRGDQPPMQTVSPLSQGQAGGLDASERAALGQPPNPGFGPGPGFDGHGSPDGNGPQPASANGPPPSAPPGFSGPLPDFGRDHGPPGLRMNDRYDAGRADIIYPAFSATWKLSDGNYRVISPPRTLIEPWQEKLLIGFGVTALIILPLAWLLSRRLSRPIVAFSQAAERLGFEDDSPPLLAVGPREVRAAADVLNAMQVRIKKQVESRTALMGAIAHDLKTPLARLRLRIEDLPSPLRDKIAQDIAHMDGLIRSAMSFTSAHKLSDTLRPLDMSALVESLCDDLQPLCPIDDTLIEDNVMVKGDTVALKRILTNLIENAGRYAGTCRVELATRGKTVEITVSDNGPGLPSDALEAVFEPFHRQESSRNRDTGGAGLGLSVARNLAEAHEGTLKLANRYDGQAIAGLDARLTLPRLTRSA